MKCSALLLAGILLLSANSSHAQAEPAYDVGRRVLNAVVPERAAPIEIMVFYPALQDGNPKSFGDNKIFEGVPTREGATMQSGKFPVVVLAHGGLRANPGMAGWIAARLAARGNLVAVPVPPPLGENDASAAAGEVWLRPHDLSTALNAVEADAGLSPGADLESAAVVGFFRGGTSALAAVGGQIDPLAYAQSCDAPNTGADCRWFERGAVNLHALGTDQTSNTFGDERFRAAVIVNPELGGSFTAESLSMVAVPVHMLQLGPADAETAELKHLISNVKYAEIPDATPFSAFSICKPQAGTILAEEGEDDAICKESANRQRRDIQEEIGRMIETALAAGLQIKF